MAAFKPILLSARSAALLFGVEDVVSRGEASSKRLERDERGDAEVGGDTKVTSWCADGDGV